MCLYKIFHDSRYLAPPSQPPFPAPASPATCPPSYPQFSTLFAWRISLTRPSNAGFIYFCPRRCPNADPFCEHVTCTNTPAHCPPPVPPSRPSTSGGDAVLIRAHTSSCWCIRLLHPYSPVQAWAPFTKCTLAWRSYVLYQHRILPNIQNLGPTQDSPAQDTH